MSTIIFATHEQGVTVGYDSRTSTDEEFFENDYPKVFRLHSNIVAGIAGSVAATQRIQYGVSALPLLSGSGLNIVGKWITNSFIPYLQTQEKDDSVDVLLAIGDRVYEVNNSAWVSQSDGIHAIGSGYPYALGALAAHVTIEQALQIAAQFDNATGGPFHVLNAKDVK